MIAGTSSGDGRKSTTASSSRLYASILESRSAYTLTGNTFSAIVLLRSEAFSSAAKLLRLPCTCAAIHHRSGRSIHYLIMKGLRLLHQCFPGSSSISYSAPMVSSSGNDGLHLKQIDGAFVSSLLTNWQLHLKVLYVRSDACGWYPSHARNQPPSIHFVDKAMAADTVLIGLSPYGLRLGLDAVNGIEHRDRAIKHAQRSLTGRESTWPGVSMLIRTSRQVQVVAVLAIVIPRSRPA